MGGRSVFDVAGNWQVIALIVGALAGYVAYLSAKEVSSASPIRFVVAGAVGGFIGALLGMQLVLDELATAGKLFAATVIGAGIGGAVFGYILRVAHPADKRSSDQRD